MLGALARRRRGVDSTSAMTHVFHRHLHHTPPVAIAGRGMFITDAAGHEYLDACGGAAVSCLGHGHPDVLAAMHAQIDRLAYAHTSFFTTEVAESLADRLVATAPAGMSHAYFVSGGSEAMEAALKMARQYFVEIGQPQRAVFVARRQSYHGNTLGALAVGGNAWRRRQFGPLLIDVVHVAPCYAYRDQRLRRNAGGLRPPARRRAGGDHRAGGGRPGDRLRRGDRRRGHRRRPDAGTRVLPGGARGLRPPRGAADPGRSDVRNGAHRHAARLRAGRRRTGPAGDCQGSRRRLPADWRGAGAAAHRRGDERGQRLLPARSHLRRATPSPARRRSPCCR